MPTPRNTLGTSDGNVQKNKELTPYTRGLIVGAAQTGLSIACIADQLNLPYSTVRTTLRLDLIRDDGLSRARSGRPKKCTDRDVRNFYDMCSCTQRTPTRKSRKP